jgi:hypothetical protein
MVSPTADAAWVSLAPLRRRFQMALDTAEARA